MNEVVMRIGLNTIEASTCSLIIFYWFVNSFNEYPRYE